MRLDSFPDKDGFFGEYGGVYVAETLVPALDVLRKMFAKWRDEKGFRAQVDALLREYVGRPSPVYHAARLSAEYGCRIYLKREDLNHTGAHKINNAVGQVLLAKKLGKKRVIAETGAGQHGVAAATVCAREGIECVVYMGSLDMARQESNVLRMRVLGAEVVPVTAGTRTLKDALNEALRDWVTNVDDTFYVIGSVAGPHPYPVMVREFNSVVGRECLAQMPAIAGRQPDVIIACVGGGSNSIGIFHPYLELAGTRLVGVEAAGEGLDTGRHAAPLVSCAPVGVLHGMRSRVMQDNGGQVLGTSSVSAGLDYPSVGPEHAWLRDTGRAEYHSATDAEALDAFADLCRLEGIIPALESAHALAYARKIAAELGPAGVLLINLSGRGDKDLATFGVARGT